MFFMRWMYYWRVGEGFYITTDKVLANDMLHGGITVFLVPFDAVASNIDTVVKNFGRVMKEDEK